MKINRVVNAPWKLIFFAAIVVFAAAACTSGSDGGIADRNTISVQGSGKAEGTPDMASVTLGVAVTDPNLGFAINEAHRVNEQINESLLAQGLGEKDIQTSMYNIWREDVYSRETGEPTGQVLYHVEINLLVNVRDIANMGTILDAALNAGANTVYGIQFGLEDTAALEAEARERAIEDLQNRAAQLAEGMGYTLGDLISVGEGIYGYPAPMVTLGLKGDVAGMGGGGAPSIQPGSSTVSVELNALYELLP
jgi:uncharacterized protein YggE